jgi:TetR/AcrR family transcriptional regulator, regulator of cefoperazone and chloramphenicol sensitivity
MAHPEGRSHATRERLLDAALEVFARDGFRGATIERICRRAGANIAAAHYHFGDKRRLYAAVFAHAERIARADGVAPEIAGPPAARLRAHVASFLHRLLDPDRPAWMAQLLAHELIDPTPALDRLVRRRMRANHEQIAGCIRELVPVASPDAVRFATLSVIAQCVFYRHSAAIVSRLYPDLDPAREVDRIADHVMRFSLAGIEGLRP